jgi:hypothetical protein
LRIRAPLAQSAAWVTFHILSYSARIFTYPRVYLPSASS